MRIDQAALRRILAYERATIYDLKYTGSWDRVRGGVQLLDSDHYLLHELEKMCFGRGRPWSGGWPDQDNIVDVIRERERFIQVLETLITEDA